MDSTQERVTRDAIGKLFAGERPEAKDSDGYGPYAEIVGEMLRALNESGVEAVRGVFETYARHDPAIAALRAADEEEEEDERSPLPTKLIPDLVLGWIDWYASVMAELTGAPLEFHQLIALTLLATVLRRCARLRMSFGDIYANIYGVIIAPPAVYHKSTAINQARRLLQLADLKHLILSELQTSEGLLAQLQELKHGIIIRDEIGTLFASDRIKHLRQLKPDLTALFDCYPYSRRLSKEEIKVREPYLNILGATTPARFGHGIRYNDWLDGFLTRWLMVTPNGKPDFKAATAPMTAAAHAQVEELAIWLANVAQHEETDFQLSPTAHQIWEQWRIQCLKDAYHHGEDITSAIVSRYSTYALKFAMILTVAMGEWGSISPDTMQTAIHLADNFKVHVHRILEQRLDQGISGAKLQRVYEVVGKHDQGQGVTKRTILQYTHIPTRQLTPLIEKLLHEGALMEAPAKRGKRYQAVGESLPIKAWR